MTTEAEQDAGQWLRARGWHQGALLPVSDTLADVACGRQHAIVASQDCDIVALTTHEPAVDLLPAVVRPSAQADLLYGKNPRRLCLALADGMFATVDVRQRVTIAKSKVARIDPVSHASVTQKDRKILAKWLGKRYGRPAFPDAFNERLATQRKKLDKLSKRDEGALITTILVMLNTEEELCSKDDYELVMWFAYRSNDAQAPEQRAKLEKYASDFAAAFGACEGLQVAEHELRPHAEITMEDLELMKRFDWDFRSEAPKPGGHVADAD